MKTEQTTTIVFTLPSGMEFRITNADPRDVEWMSGIERAVAAERERCAKVCEAVADGGRKWPDSFEGDTASTRAARKLTGFAGDECAAAIRAD